jgi:hypothetical protein
MSAVLSIVDNNHFVLERREILLEHAVDPLLDQPFMIKRIDDYAEPHSITPVRKESRPPHRSIRLAR